MGDSYVQKLGAADTEFRRSDLTFRETGVFELSHLKHRSAKS
jgi:hypothetical protein